MQCPPPPPPPTAKIQVTASFLKHDMRRNYFAQIQRELYVDAMLEPISNMAAGNQQKHLSLSCATKA